MKGNEGAFGANFDVRKGKGSKYRRDMRALSAPGLRRVVRVANTKFGYA